jgi:phosphate transport system substrate-binding protein
MIKRLGTALAAVMMVALGAASQTLINGGGATFPYPMYSKWFNDYKNKSGVAINYQSQGSGFGVQQLTANTIDFGASDYALTDMQIKDFQDKRGMGVLHFPTVLGADVPTYNLPGVTATLNFTPDALAGIFLGKITKWNDPELVKANPGVNLPKDDIVVVHREENSGTTFIWTDYLTKVSKEWEMKVNRGAGVKWPVGLGAKGNEAVAGQIKNTKYSMGYVELTYVLQNKMPNGKVKNADGQFIEADLASVTAAAAATAKTMPEDFRVSITNAPGKGAYPISSFTWMLVPEKIADPAKKKAITDFLTWMLKDGQTMTGPLSYAPLPKEVVAKETKQIAKIK